MLMKSQVILVDRNIKMPMARASARAATVGRSMNGGWCCTTYNKEASARLAERNACLLRGARADARAISCLN